MRIDDMLRTNDLSPSGATAPAPAPAGAFDTVLAGATVAASAGTTAAAPPAVAARDFTHMTRAEMREVAKEMFERGEIDLDQQFKLLFSGPVGNVGAGGTFIPFTDAEWARIDQQPVDYVQLAHDAMDGIRSQGRQVDSTSGYQDWQRILDVLTAG
jgi:hypothetical protein